MEMNSAGNWEACDKDKERFMSHIKKTDTCWIWQGDQARGYGTFWLNGSMRRANRVSYELHYGPLKRGMQACHKCDVPLCVRPDHLFEGTNRDNTLDAFKKGRHPIGEAKKHAKLTNQAVLEIRSLRDGGLSYPVIAKRFNVAVGTIYNVITGRSWAHV